MNPVGTRQTRKQEVWGKGFALLSMPKSISHLSIPPGVSSGTAILSRSATILRGVAVLGKHDLNLTHGTRRDLGLYHSD